MFLQRIQGNLAEPIFVHNPRINVHFYFKSSIANNCRYFLWMVKKYPLQAKLRNLIVSLDKLYETHFHDVVVFVIKTSTMANPGYWTIIKL